jgi:hypothetical protein
VKHLKGETQEQRLGLVYVPPSVNMEIDELSDKENDKESDMESDEADKKEDDKESDMESNEANVDSIETQSTEIIDLAQTISHRSRDDRMSIPKDTLFTFEDDSESPFQNGAYEKGTLHITKGDLARVEGSQRPVPLKWLNDTLVSYLIR